jgi:hypothetical protein
MGVKVKETANTTASQLRAVPLGLLDQFLTSVGGLTLVTLIEKDGNVTKPKHNKLVLGSDTFTIDEANVRWWRIKAKMLKETAPKTLLGARGWRLSYEHITSVLETLLCPPPMAVGGEMSESDGDGDADEEDVSTPPATKRPRLHKPPASASSSTSAPSLPSLLNPAPLPPHSKSPSCVDFSTGC